MNSLVFLPLMAAMVIAAPGGVPGSQFPASTGPLAVGVVAPAVEVRAAPAVVAAAPAVEVRSAPAVVAAAPAVSVQHVQAVAPAVAHVSVPVTKTVHYETRPVVTGYTSQIIKPAIPHFNAPVFQAVNVQEHVSVAAPAVAVQQVQAVAPAAVAAPVQQVVHSDAEIIEARSAVVAAPAAVAVRAPQAGDFGPLVTKEQILAPVRTHTQITPQITQIQPEVTVRKVVHDVPVATPVAVHNPVEVRVNQPIVAAPQVHTAFATTNVVAGPHFVGNQWVGHAGQFVF